MHRPVLAGALALARHIRIEDEISRRNINLRGRGPERCGPCPVCGGTDRFSINIKKQVWNCRICAKGGDTIALVMHLDCVEIREACRILTGDGPRPSVAPREVAKEQKPDEDKARLAAFLWGLSRPAPGTVVENYLRFRGCPIDSPNIRFLPGRGDHPPAMISRFGDGPVTGIHLTKLASDGKGKARTDKDKIMIGPSIGQPILVADNPERGELIIAEGIEDTASLALVTGWTAWAAGAAGRIPPLVKAARHFERIFLAVDRDRAAALALRRSREFRPDLVPLHFAKMFDIKESLDANKALIRFGADAILASIEWCEAQQSYRSGQITFHEMQAAMQRANMMFTEMVG